MSSSAPVHNLTHMETLRTRFLEALETAVETLGDVADGCDRAYRTLQSYRLDERRVTTDAARDLVAYLRRRAEELHETADRLEAAADEEESDV